MTCILVFVYFIITYMLIIIIWYNNKLIEAIYL